MNDLANRLDILRQHLLGTKEVCAHTSQMLNTPAKTQVDKQLIWAITNMENELDVLTAFVVYRLKQLQGKEAKKK